VDRLYEFCKSNEGKECYGWCEKRHLFLSAFPMFVPSLSWQNDRFYI